MRRGRRGGDPGVRRSWFSRANAASPQRLVQILLGCVWLADGALQLQHFMFGRGFVTGMLMPTAAGNPIPVAGSITAMARFLEPHVAAWNALFAATQLAIGGGLLFRRTVRPALAVSFVWSLAVWWFAEGLGGLLTGTASPLSGAPGAVLLYILVGLLAWPVLEERRGEQWRRGGGGLLGGVGARIAWAVLWVGSAALLLRPGNSSGLSLRNALMAARAGQPGWYAGMLTGTARVLGSHGTLLTFGIAAEMALVGIGVALDWQTPRLLGVATVLAALIWVFPEGLGGVLTGQGTDPNTGPLLALAGLAWYRSWPDPAVARIVVPTVSAPTTA